MQLVPQIVVDLFHAADESLIQLRTEIKNPRFGPIETKWIDSGLEVVPVTIGTILFGFRNEIYKAPEPTDIIFGFNPELDKRIALKSLLNKTAIKVKSNV